MSGAVGIQVLGDDVVVLNLGRAAAAGASGVTLERALVSGALPPTNTAKRLCPKRTGNLGRSIHIGGHSEMTGGLRGSTGTHGGTSGTNIGGNEHGKGWAHIQVGTNVEYAIYIEYGHHTRGHGIDRVGSDRAAGMDMTHWVPAQPFLRPAFDGAGEEIAAEMSRILKAVIEAAL